MGLQIESGTGNGKMAQVNEENMLNVKSVTEPLIAHTSHDAGKAYFAHSSYTTTDVTQRVLSIKNTSADKNLYIDKIYLATDTTCKWIVEKVTAGTGAGTDVTPVNLNFTSGNTADGTFKGNAEVTGITGATHLGHWNLLADTSDEIDFQGALILGQNDEIAIKIAETTVAVGATIFFHYT